MSTEDEQANANALAHLESLGIHKPKTTSAAPVIPPRADVSTGPRVHELKVQTQFWDDLWNFRTTAQLRQDDRQYRVGDVLDLREYNPQFGFTGMNCRRRVTHILRHEDVPYGVRRGWCILSTAVMDTRSSEDTFRAGFEAGDTFRQWLDSERMTQTREPNVDDAWAAYRDAVGTT
jgi:hypothetical protein